MHPDSSTTPLYVAIDIGKNVHCYGAYAGPDLRPVRPPQDVRSTRLGYSQLQTWLREQIQAGQYAPLIVGMEPTGIYHEAWAYALQADFGSEIGLRFLNPYQTKQKRKQLQNGRRRKSDPLDVEAIAHCLRDGLGNPACLHHDQTLSFELWAADFRQLHHEQQRVQLDLLTQIDRLWPGALVDIKAFRRAHPTLQAPEPLLLSHPLQRTLLRLMLEHRPNPHDWTDLSQEDIQAFFRSHHLRCGPHTARKVFQVVQEALLPPPNLAIPLAQRLQTTFARYQHIEQGMAQLQQQAEELVPSSPAAVLLTFSGIGAFLAAQYLAYVVDIQRFAHADQVWSLAGFDVQQDDSGDRRHLGKITKRGHPGLRQVLFSIGLNTSQHCPAIAQAKQRALQRGKGPVGAVIHAAHKANRICFHLLKHQVPFDIKQVR